MSDRSLCSVSVLQGALSVLLGVGCQGIGANHLRLEQVGCPAVAVYLGVDAVQVLGNADASTVQQELGQEVALCC